MEALLSTIPSYLVVRNDKNQRKFCDGFVPFIIIILLRITEFRLFINHNFCCLLLDPGDSYCYQMFDHMKSTKARSILTIRSMVNTQTVCQLKGRQRKNSISRVHKIETMAVEGPTVPHIIINRFSIQIT